MPLNVTFRAGTMAQYNALQTKDEGALYFITDKNLIYKGNTLVTSRYLMSSIPSQPGDTKINGFRITDQVTGNTYDIPFLSSVNTMLSTELVLHFYDQFIEKNSDLLTAIKAVENTPGTGIFESGTVYRISDTLFDGNGDQVNSLRLNPGQFAYQDGLTVKSHDLVVALVSHDRGDVAFKSNHECFAVIPVDLVNLVTADGVLADNAIVLGNGAKTIKSLQFAGANKILRTNSSNNGVEWVTPETVQNVIAWEDIVVE